MSRELISKATKNEFRQVLTGYVLGEIDMLFEVGGLAPLEGYQSNVSGQRRALIETYNANIDFSSVPDIRWLLTIYEETMEGLQRACETAPNERLQATIKGLLRRMEREGFRYVNGHFVSDALNAAVVSAPSLVKLTEESIQEHVEKARQKIASRSSARAIANAYTLVEEFLKQLLRKPGAAFSESEVNIRALYKLLAIPLILAPKNDSLETHLKIILGGLQQQFGGSFEVANKASDRHARRHNPARRRAKLAVNVAFTLCEFLVKSHEYQQKREERRAS